VHVRFSGPTGAILDSDGGVQGVVREAPGQYLITFARAIAARETHVKVTALDTAAWGAGVEYVSATQIRLRLGRL